MRRRALLAALASGPAGIAGCSLQGAPSETVTPAPVPTMETPSPSDGADGDVAEAGPDALVSDAASVVELETASLTCALWPTQFHTGDGATVSLGFSRPATDEHPARIVGYLENGNDVETSFRLDRISAVGRLHSRRPDESDREARIHLAPLGGNEIAAAVPSVARTDDGHWYVEEVGPWMPETVHLDPAEWVVLEYALVGERETPAWPTGTYEFPGRGVTASVAVWNTDGPGPDESSRFAGRTVPAISDGRAVQWYHEADATTAAFLRPSTERVELAESIEFVMVNHSHASLGCGHWHLHKLVDGAWFLVAPLFHTTDCRMLAPGGRIRWTLRGFDGKSVPCGGDGCGGDVLTKGFLGGGTYAVVADYGHRVDGSGALVELAADPVEIVPTVDAEVDRRGSTIIVTTSRHGDDDHPPDDSFSLTRTDAAEERVIAEQVMATRGVATLGRGVRNGLAAFDAGVERVVVRSDEPVVDAAVGTGASTRRFSFRGQAYVASRDAEGA